MWTAAFAKALAERVLATMIEVAIPMFTLTTLDKVDFATTGLVVLSAGVLSFLKGVLAGLVGSSGTPSITNAEVLAPPVVP
jgi:hypothetical protein